MKTEPNDTVDYNPIAQQCTGLTKREYFAALNAAAGIASMGDRQLNETAMRAIVSEAVKISDYLINELNLS